ncbi:hypothetical protein L3V86_00215 [Thiotrichales bacterium 19S11-10]|nr:hypothetical protein [Thiotrichales bacterium 19S11-10]
MQYAVTRLSKKSFIEACDSVLKIIRDVDNDEGKNAINSLKSKISSKAEKLISPDLRRIEFNESISQLEKQINSLKTSNPSLEKKLNNTWSNLVKQLVPIQQSTSPEPKFLPKKPDAAAHGLVIN